MSTRGERRGPSQPFGRCGHVAVSIDRFMIVWGGYHVVTEEIESEQYLPGDELWIYDSDVDRWYNRKAIGDIPPGTSGACAVPVGTKMYLFGGFTEEGSNTNEIFCLDLAQPTPVWSHIPHKTDDTVDQPSPRDKHALWEYNNKIFVFGGFGPPIHSYLFDQGRFELDRTTTYWSHVRGWNNQLLVYDIATGKWTNPNCKGKWPTPRAAMSAARLGNKVYIFGGRFKRTRMNDLHCFDLDNYVWTGELDVGNTVPDGRTWHSFTSISNNDIFLYGGFTQDREPLSDAWIFNSDNSRWTQLDVPKSQPRLWHTACRCANSDILIFGGCTNNILDSEIAAHANTMLFFRRSPKSLLRLSLDKAFEYHKQLYDEWENLPQSLRTLLLVRLEGKQDISPPVNNDVSPNQQNRHRHSSQHACTLS